MVKFLKFVLFLVVIAFAFSLGVKFSDSFKSTLTDSKVEKQIKKEINNENSKIEEVAPAENTEEVISEEEILETPNMEMDNVETLDNPEMENTVAPAENTEEVEIEESNIDSNNVNSEENTGSVDDNELNEEEIVEEATKEAPIQKTTKQPKKEVSTNNVKTTPATSK